jgi:hypothetical protein
MNNVRRNTRNFHIKLGNTQMQLPSLRHIHYIMGTIPDRWPIIVL